MPSKKQVQTLKQLSVRGVEKFIECVSLELVAVVSEFCKRDNDLGYGFLRASITHLGNHLFQNAPYVLLGDIVQGILNLLPRLVGELRATYIRCFCIKTFMIKMRIVVLLTSILLHPRIQYIDISRLPKPMKHVLLCDLFKMSGLKSLDLGAGSGGWEISETEKTILKGLTCMHNLAQLHLSVDCTDAIIKCISLNCKQLQVLNIPNSRSVTNRCVPHVITMSKLKHICITHTSIDHVGHTELLFGLPQLVNIGKCEFINPVMKAVKEKEFILNLTHLECGIPDSVSMLIDSCPRLVNLVLHNVHEIDLSPLCKLDHLRSLSLISGNIEKIKLLAFLQAYNKLECLHLRGMHTIDEACLMSISNYCPNLTRFLMDSCECVSRGSFEPHFVSTNNKYFSRLEHLSCYNSCEMEHLKILLKSAHGIQSITLGNSIMADDTFIDQMVSFNPFPQLKEFKILHCHTLTARSVYTLIAHCPILSSISELKTWYLISKDDFVRLQDYVREHNLDLVLSSVEF